MGAARMQPVQRDKVMNEGKAKIKATANRSRATAEKPSEIMLLATKHGITPVQAKNLLARFGTDRVSLDAVADRLKIPSH